MDLLNELDKLYKMKLKKVKKYIEVKSQIELHHMEKRIEMVKAESKLLLDRCVIWQNEIKSASSVSAFPPMNLIEIEKSTNKKRKEPTAGIMTDKFTKQIGSALGIHSSTSRASSPAIPEALVVDDPSTTASALQKAPNASPSMAGSSKLAHSLLISSIPIRTHSMVLRRPSLPSSSLPHQPGTDNPHSSAPASKDLSLATSPSFESGKILAPSSDVPHPSLSNVRYDPAQVLRDLSPDKAQSFEEGEIRDDESEPMQSINREEETVKYKSEAAAAPVASNQTKKVGNKIHRNSPTSGPSPSAFNAPNQLISATKRLSPANQESSKSGQTSLDGYLKDMRTNAKVMKEAGGSPLRMQIKYPNQIDLNSTPSDEPVSDLVPDITHSFALAQSNSPHLGQLPANANSPQPLLLEPGQGSSHGVDKHNRLEGEDGNKMIHIPSDSDSEHDDENEHLHLAKKQKVKDFDLNF